MDDQTLITYRSLSTGAIVALLLAFASLLVFVAPYLWPLPWVAAVACWRAKAHIDRNPETLTGAWMPLLGFFLAVVISIASVVRPYVAEHYHAAQVDRLAEEVLVRLSKEDVAGAFELTQLYELRQPASELIEAHYVNSASATEQLEKFRQKPEIVALTGVDLEQVKQLATPWTVPARFGRYTSARVYEVPSQQAEAKPMIVVLLFERSSPQRKSMPLNWRLKETRIK